MGFKLPSGKVQIPQPLNPNTDEQKDAFKYISSTDGWLASLKKAVARMKIRFGSEARPAPNKNDLAYITLANRQIDSFNAEKRGIELLGLDASQVSQVQKFKVRGYEFDGKWTWAREGADFKWRSSKIMDTILFVSDDQMFIYQVEFSTVNFLCIERTAQVFLKDIVAVCFNKEFKLNEGETDMVESSVLRIQLPDYDIIAAAEEGQSLSQTIQGIQAKVREAKLRR